VSSLNPITTIIEKLIADARPVVLPGSINPPDNIPPTQIKVIQQAIQTYQQMQQPQDQALRESAQAILADLWLVGQRFKTVSASHASVSLLAYFYGYYGNGVLSSVVTNYYVRFFI
jgi:hypothetical protein